MPRAERLTAGVDEVGRGPLAGPVVAAAVILHPRRPLDGLADSKSLTPCQRERLCLEIRESAICYAIGRAEVEEIDRLNILQASLLAMQRAVAALPVLPDMLLIDGLHCLQGPCASRAIVGGDAVVPAISAASILAKVARDREMRDLDPAFPGYGFKSHKGYCTAQHIDALMRLGPCAIHRRSFAPVREALRRPGFGAG